MNDSSALLVATGLLMLAAVMLVIALLVAWWPMPSHPVKPSTFSTCVAQTDDVDDCLSANRPEK